MQDEDVFFKDYAESHKKLSELGFIPPSAVSKVKAKESAVLAQSAVGVAVAAAVVILSYFYEIRKKMKWTWLNWSISRLLSFQMILWHLSSFLQLRSYIIIVCIC